MGDKLTLASGLHVGKETRVGLFIAVEVCVGYGREYGIVHAGSTCKYICCCFRVIAISDGETKKRKTTTLFLFPINFTSCHERKCNCTQKVFPPLCACCCQLHATCACVACCMRHKKLSVDINKSALINEFTSQQLLCQIFIPFGEIIKKSRIFFFTSVLGRMRL